MQCRNAFRRHVDLSIAQTAVTPTISYQWITDEQLSEAFARFVRVSRSSKRFGSNVPGPLEARRRQSRRRIGIATSGASQGTCLAEFGALFGAGQRRTGIFEWEPPSRRKQTSEELPPTCAYFQSAVWNVQPCAQQAWSSHTVEASADSLLDRETIDMQHEATQEGEDAVRKSQDTFRDLLSRHELGKQLSAANIASLLVHLESAQNEPRAKNLLALLQWMKLQGVDKSGFIAVRDMVISKHQLKAISPSQFKAALHPLLGLIKDQPNPDKKAIYLDSLAILADHIKHCHDMNTVPARRLNVVYRHLFRSITPQAQSPKSLVDALEALGVLAIRRNDFRMAGAFVAHAVKDILSYLPTFEEYYSTQYVSIMKALVSILRSSKEQKLVPMVTHILLHDPVLRRDSSALRLHELIVFWLQCLHRNKSFSTRIPRDRLLESWAAYRLVGREVKPQQIARHLQYLHRLAPVQMATAMMLAWVDTWRSVSNVTITEEEKPFSSCIASEPHNKLSLDDLEQALFQEFQFTQISRMQNPLITLLLTLKQHGHNAELLLTDLFAIFIHPKYNIHQLYDFYKEVKLHGLPIPVDQQALLVNHLLSQKYSLRALHVYLECPELPLSMVPTLPEQLISDGNDPAYVLDLIPQKIRVKDKGRYKWPVSQNVIDLVSELATKVASADQYTASLAFNRVWRCYRFLRQHNVELDASISQAMVQSGIIRALQTETTLPNIRLDYIVGMVRWYEGDAIADRLEQQVQHDRQKTSLRRRQPEIFRLELDDPARWSQRLMPRF